MKFSTLTRPGSTSISLNCPVQSTTSLLSCSAPPHDCTLTTPTTRVPLSRAQSCYSKQHYIDQRRGPRLIEKRHRAPSQLGGQCISLQLALMELEKHDKESRDHCSKMLDLMKAEAEANRPPLPSMLCMPHHAVYFEAEVSVLTLRLKS
eukprot:6207996-Pleurochrysis_carterae.AAC.1